MVSRQIIGCAAACVAALACSRGENVEPAASGERAPAAGKPAAPDGVDAKVWRDIATFPPNTVSISGFPDARKLGFITGWLRDLEVPGWPDCVKEQVDRVDRYYMAQVLLPDGSVRDTSTLVFYGSLDPDEANACARQAAAVFGEEVRFEEGVTVFGDGAMFLRWGQTGDETAVIFDAERAVVGEYLDGETSLDPEAPVVGLLRDVDVTADMWSVGEIDFTEVPLEVPSRGYDVSFRVAGDLAPDSEFEVAARVRVHFDSPPQAEKARAALEGYLSGLGSEVAGVLGDVLAASVVGEALVLELAADHGHLDVLMAAFVEAAQDFQGREATR